MANVKEVVNLLCSILEEMGCSPLLPETFRRAKFDDPSVNDDIWKLLFELICFKKSGTVKQSFSNISISDMALFVKREMFVDGYNIGSFIALPVEKTEKSCSRELLLAFGWLIATGRIMELFASQCADVDSLYIAEAKRQLSVDNPKQPRSARGTPRLDLEQKIQEALVTNGRLQTLFKSIAQADREHLKLLQRLECTKSSPDVMKNPSTINVVLSGQASLITDAIKLLERDKRRLTYLVHWRQQELQFWQWLESVIDEKAKNSTPVSPEDLTAGYSQIMGDTYQKMTDLLHLASQSETRLRDRVSDVTPEDADRLVELINNDLEEFLKGPELPPKMPDKDVKPIEKFGRHQDVAKSVKPADLGLQKLCDRIDLELKVNQKEFSSLLKHLADYNFS